jgi:hypothetical protein
LAELLGQLGATVEVTSQPPSGSAGEGAVLILHDQLNADQHRVLMDWVRAGGTVVLADVTSNLGVGAPARQPGPLGFVAAPDQLTPECGSPAVSGVQVIDAAGGVLLRPRPAAQICFPGDDRGNAYMLSRSVGRGTVVEVGGPGLWTNDGLGRADNSVLAANLLVPRSGTHVWWLSGPSVGGGHQSLWQLIPSRAKEAMGQLLIVAVLVALWRGRRLGRPVVESQPVEIPGSELVVAVGNLLEQGRRRPQAAERLRADLTRMLADRYGLAPTGPPELLAEVASARSGVDRHLVLATLTGPLPADDASVLRLAEDAIRIREEVARVR